MINNSLFSIDAVHEKKQVLTYFAFSALILPSRFSKIDCNICQLLLGHYNNWSMENASTENVNEFIKKVRIWILPI